MAGLGLVQSLAVITHCLLLLPGALVTAAVVLGVPVTKSGVPANTIFSLLGTNVATPEPALFVGTLGWVAAGVAGTIRLEMVASVGTCPIAENSAVVVQGGISFAAITGSLLWRTNVVTPVPTLIIRAVLRVAGHVASSVGLYLVVVRTAAVEDTVITGCGAGSSL